MSCIRISDINEGVRLFRQDEGATLIDVRAYHEYNDGHIPESINVPLTLIGDIEDDIPDKSAAVYVYCLSGNRSRQAAAVLDQIGYEKVLNIGGIEDYNGDIEK